MAKNGRRSDRRDQSRSNNYDTAGGGKVDSSIGTSRKITGKDVMQFHPYTLASNAAKGAYDAYDKSLTGWHNKMHEAIDPSIDRAAKAVDRNLKKGPNYTQNNPTASGGRRGGQMDREWQNHKWISRERNDAGKWIYDYGGGTSTGARPKAYPKGVDPRKRGAGKINKNSDVRSRGVDSDDFPKKYNNLFEETTDKAGRALNDAGSAAKKTFDEVGSNVGKAISDAGENINKTISSLALDAKVTVTAGKMFLDTLFK